MKDSRTGSGDVPLDRAKQAARHEEVLGAIFRAIPDLMFRLDAEGRIVESQAGRQSDLYVSPEVYIGQAFTDVLPTPVASLLESGVERVRSGEPLAVVEYDLLVPSGPKRFEARVVTVLDGFLVLVRDVTPTREAERALVESEARYRDLVETSGDLIWSTDAEGRWTFLNHAAAARILGYDVEEMLGRPFSDFQTRQQAERDRVIRSQIRTGDRFQYETSMIRKDGAEVILSVNAISRRDSGGHVTGWVGTASDITERRRAESERKKLDAKVQQAQKLESLGVLAGGIAHDFNNLLVGILGGADLALASLPPEASTRQHLLTISQAAQRASELSRQMLAYSGKGSFLTATVDVGQVVQEIIKLLEVSISKKAQLSLALSDEYLPVHADVTQLRQVVMNLITNASDALGDDVGVISVKTGTVDCSRRYLSETDGGEALEPGSYVFIEVADTGCGMDAQTRRKMFDPFFTTKRTGRGLGLAAVLGIVRGHHGSISVTSAPERGTSVRVLLPPARRSYDPAEIAAFTPAATTESGLILVVDDEATVREVTAELLRDAGYEVITANDGFEAVSTVRERAPGVQAVILDLTMPGMGGLQTFRALRRVSKDLRIILMTGYDAEEVLASFGDVGLSGFVQKPYRAAELLAVVREALSSRAP